MQARVLEHGLDLVKVRDMQGAIFSCTTFNFVEEKDGFVYYAAGQMRYIGQEDLDPTTANVAVAARIPIESDILSFVGRDYGLKALAAPAGVLLSTDEGLAVMRTFMTAPDYAVALIWFYVFGSYAGGATFSDVVWVGEPGRSLLFIRQGGREAHIVGLARDYIAFWWGLAGGWGNAPSAPFPVPSYLAFRDMFRYLEPDPARVRFLSEVQTQVWSDDVDKYLLPEASLFELRLRTHSIYFGRAGDELFPITYGRKDAVADAIKYPSDELPWSRASRVQCAVEYKVPRASLATSLGLPYFVV